MPVQCGTFDLGHPVSGELHATWKLDQACEGCHTAKVHFPVPFESIPTVCVALSGIDAEVEADKRLQVKLEVRGLDREFFVVTLSKAGGCKINRLDVAWMAHG